MADKAYIVANKEQELDVLKKLERKGFKWGSEELPTEFIFSDSFWFDGFPYVITEHKDIGYIGWTYDSRHYNGNIVYDGRKEGKMYKVPQEFMDELIKWRNDNGLETKTGYMYEAVEGDEIERLPGIVCIWWNATSNSIELNNRLIAIIKWLNGEDVFEVEEPHKFVVRNDTPDYDGDYYYVQAFDGVTHRSFSLEGATKFDTREEAQEWANSHQVIIEIDEEGNEVE